MRIVTSLLLGAIVVAAAGSVAHAQGGPALVISDLHLRAAPTQNSPSLGVIPGGSTVEAGPCGGGWCSAFVNGQSGYVSQQYLDFGGGGPGPGPGAYVPVPPPGYGPPPPPPVVYGPPPYYGPYGPPPPPYWWRRW